MGQTLLDQSVVAAASNAPAIADSPSSGSGFPASVCDRGSTTRGLQCLILPKRRGVHHPKYPTRVASVPILPNCWRYSHTPLLMLHEPRPYTPGVVFLA